MNGIYFIFLALITSVSSFLILKTVLHTKSTSDPSSYAAISFLFTAIYALTFYFITSFHLQDFQQLLHPQIGLFVLADVVVWALASSFFYPAYKHLPVSETTIANALVGFFALVFGLLLFKTETFHLSRFFGGILILISVALITAKNGKWKFGGFTLLLFTATIFIGLASVMDNVIIAHNYFTSVAFLSILNYGITAFVLLAFNPKSIGKLHTVYTDKKVLLTVTLNSFINFLTFFFIYNGYKFHLVASQANLILSTQTVIVVLLGSFLFKEKGSIKMKILAGIIATIGVYLIS